MPIPFPFIQFLVFALAKAVQAKRTKFLQQVNRPKADMAGGGPIKRAMILPGDQECTICHI
jgi:hypothetical protein